MARPPFPIYRNATQFPTTSRQPQPAQACPPAFSYFCIFAPTSHFSGDSGRRTGDPATVSRYCAIASYRQPPEAGGATGGVFFLHHFPVFFLPTRFAGGIQRPFSRALPQSQNSSSRFPP